MMVYPNSNINGTVYPVVTTVNTMGNSYPAANHNMYNPPNGQPVFGAPGQFNGQPMPVISQSTAFGANNQPIVYPTVYTMPNQVFNPGYSNNVNNYQYRNGYNRNQCAIL